MAYQTKRQANMWGLHGKVLVAQRCQKVLLISTVLLDLHFT
jgi:hypothetical protein